jgi:sugar O-acyltransferase (sialic acid O-acetyltransferase NeuD family)
LKKIIIVGARIDGHAKVVLEIMQAQRKYEVVGFIDDNLNNKGITIRNIPVIGTMSDLPQLIKKFNIYGGIVAIGNNQQRRNLGLKIKNTGLELINAIHPTVHIDSDVQIGEGNCFCQGVIIVTGSKLGNSINIHTGATIDHDNIIEDGANIGTGAHTAGRVTICKDAFLGAGTVVIPDGIVGEGAITGAGTVVIRPVEPYTKVVGVPAKIIEKINK